MADATVSKAVAMVTKAVAMVIKAVAMVTEAVAMVTNAVTMATASEALIGYKMLQLYPHITCNFVMALAVPYYQYHFMAWL